MTSALLAFGFLLAAALLVPQAVSAASDSAARGLSQFLNGVIASLTGMKSAVAGFVQRAGGVSPVAAFGGVLAACAAVPIARSEFAVAQRSLLLVWADEIASDRIALSLVLMTFVVGLLMHAHAGRAARRVLGIIALSLTIMTASLAYYRTIEIEKIRLSTEATALLSPHDGSELLIGGLTGAEDRAPAASVSPREPDRLPAFLAGLLALLLSLGGIVIGFGAFSLGSPALVAFAAFPALVMLWISSATAQLALVAVGGLSTALAELLKTWLNGRPTVVRFVKSLFPCNWTAEADAWRQARAERSAEFTRRKDEREAAANRARSERMAETNGMERDRDFAVSQEDRDRRSVSAALDTSRDQLHQAHLEGVRELLETMADQRREFLQESVREVFRNLRGRAAKVPFQVASMLFWPLDRVWQMMGDNFSRRSSGGEPSNGPPADPAAPNPTKEDSIQ